MKTLLSILALFCFLQEAFAQCTTTYGTDTQVSCAPLSWINGASYTQSNNSSFHTLVNAEGCDSIVQLDLTIIPNSSGIDVHTACDSFEWIDGNTYTESNNTATYTLTNVAGCDSLVELDLTMLHSVETTFYLEGCGSVAWDGMEFLFPGIFNYYFPAANGCDSVIHLNIHIFHLPEAEFVLSDETTLQATDFAEMYHWFYCDSTTVLSTSPTFTMPGNGSYYLVATDMFCSDTSDCITIDNVSLKESDAFSVTLAPNPTADGLFRIDMNGVETARMTLRDLSGKTVLSAKDVINHETISLASYESGVYMISLTTSFGSQTYRLIRQ